MLLITLILVWRKFRAVDKRFEQMKHEINELRWIESRLFLMALNPRPTAVDAEAECQNGPGSSGSTTGGPSVNLSVPSVNLSK
jgi:hypothetical protein